jgi:CRP-like cAMP-binding protein
MYPVLQFKEKGGGSMQSFHVDGDGYFVGHGALFEALNRPRSYGKNQIIYQQGENADYVYYLKSGRVKVYIPAQDGRETTLTRLSAGSLFGKASFFDGTPRTSSAKALVKSEIVLIDKQMMAEVFRQKPDVALELLAYLSKSIRMLSMQIDGLALTQADKRTARFLLEHCDKATGEVPYTHEEIGEQAGLSRVTVSRVLGQFRQWGWLDTAYRRTIIKDIAALTHFIED